MVEFFRKFENPGIKIARVNSILLAKSIDLQLFTSILIAVGGPFAALHWLPTISHNHEYLACRRSYFPALAAHH